MKLDLNALNIFIKVAECSSFSLAARELDIPKATVSRRIKELEDSLKIKLIHRNTRKLSLTNEGEKLFEHSYNSLKNLLEVESLLRNQQLLSTTTIRISSTKILVEKLLNKILFNFKKVHSEVQLEIITDNNYDDLIQRRINFCLRVGKLKDSNYKFHLLGKIKYIACCSANYYRNSDPIRQPTDLENHECIGLLKQSSDWKWQFEKLGKKIIVRTKGTILFSDLELALQAALEGQGIAYLPYILIKDELKNGKLIELLSGYKTLERDLYLLYPANKYISSIEEKLLDDIKKGIRL